MKKIIDNKENVISDMLIGYEKAYADRVYLKGNVLVRKNKKDVGKVAVIIGNGSGHEPGMIDLVGKGLFDANICGDVFTAPTPIQMIEGIKEVDNGSGVLILVSSHQGDILNAKMAVMLAKAEGIDARMVVLWDDISSAPKEKFDERRGAIGLFFPFKIVCSAAEMGLSMDELLLLAERVRTDIRSLSVAVAGGTHPQTGLKTFELPDDEIEVGMGVHGEAGSGRMKMCPAKQLVDNMMQQLIDDGEYASGDEVMVLVNNAGATTRMELLIVYKNICEFLESKGIKILRNWVGTYVTSQEAQGFSIGLCKAKSEYLPYYDLPVDSPIF